MKTAVVLLGGGIRQIMLYAETEAEKMALKSLATAENEQMSVDFKEGGFYTDIPPSARGYVVQECRGDYYRAFDSDDGLMIVVRPKPKE